MSDRQRWEYCDVDGVGEITYYAITGDHHKDPAQDSPHGDIGRAQRAVAWLGESGWEAYSVSAGLPTVFFLKRPMQ